MNQILDSIANHAQDCPERDALIDARGALSYAVLSQRIEQVAAWLSRLGMDRLGLYADNSSDWIVADLAAWRAGITLVPIPTFFSPAQRAHVVATAQLPALLIGNSLRLAADGSAIATPAMDTPLAGLTLVTLPGEKHDRRLDLRGVAKVTFTSGTTGRPKGVSLDDHALTAVTESLARRIHVGELRDSLALHLNVLPLSTLLENIAGVYLPLYLGKTVLALSSTEVGLQGSSGLQVATLHQAILKHRANSLILLPQILHALVHALECGMPRLPDLGFVAVGGASTAPALLSRARAVGIPVFEGYGLSECASVVALNSPSSCADEADQAGAVGDVLPHLALRIDSGTIKVKGPMARAYITEDGMQPMPLDREGWLDTGDLGYLDARGGLHVTGRAKNLLISSFGRNISPEWIESAIAMCPSVAQSMVVGDAQPYCAALIVAREPGVSTAQITSQLAAANADLPDYAQVRRFTRLDQGFSVANGMLTENGRLKRAHILEHHATRIAALYSQAAGNSGIPTGEIHDLF